MKTKLIKFLLRLLGQNSFRHHSRYNPTPATILIESAEHLEESVAYEIEEANVMRKRLLDCMDRVVSNRSQAAALRIAADKLRQAE